MKLSCRCDLRFTNLWVRLPRQYNLELLQHLPVQQLLRLVEASHETSGDRYATSTHILLPINSKGQGSQLSPEIHAYDYLATYFLLSQDLQLQHSFHVHADHADPFCLEANRSCKSGSACQTEYEQIIPKRVNKEFAASKNSGK